MTDLGLIKTGRTMTIWCALFVCNSDTEQYLYKLVSVKSIFQLNSALGRRFPYIQSRGQHSHFKRG